MIPLLNRGGLMKGLCQGADRQQTTLLAECLDDWVDESNPVRAVDVFVDALELRELGFDGVTPAATGRPGYHPSAMLKLYIYGYLNRVQSSRRLEREAGRNLEVMWLTGRLVPDHKTIADSTSSVSSHSWPRSGLEERVLLCAPCDRSGRSARLAVASGLTPDSIHQKYAQTVASTWIAPGCPQFLGEEKRFHTTWTHSGPDVG